MPGPQGLESVGGMIAGFSHDISSFQVEPVTAPHDAELTVIFSKEWLLEAGGAALGQWKNFEDLAKVHALLKDFGWKGTWYALTRKSGEYVIFKGAVSSRAIFTSSQYLANDAKVMQFAIGGRGVYANAVQSGVWTIVAVGCWDTVKFLLTGGDATDFLAELTSNAVKGAIGLGATAYVSTLIAGAGGVIVLPIVGGVVVGVAVGFGLNYLDDCCGLTQALKGKLNEVEAAMVAAYDAAAKAVEERERDWGYWYYWNVEKPLENMVLNAAGGGF
jgi:hypothetical protein